MLDTSARPDTPELTRRRQAQIAMARGGRFAEVAGSIPGARLVVVAGAGHLTTLDQPEQVTRALVAWLQA